MDVFKKTLPITPNYTQYIELKNLCSRIKIDAYYKIIPSSKFFQRPELDDTQNVPIADVKAISGIKDIQVLLEFYSHSTAEEQDKVLAITSLQMSKIGGKIWC